VSDASDVTPEDAPDADEHHTPVGAIFLMGLYTLALVGAWVWVYTIALGRS
jgi:hypothetical protein